MIAVNGHGVIAGVLALPRVGAWVADLELDTDSQVSGPVTLDVSGALKLVGTVATGGGYQGAARVRIVGGKDGLRKAAKPVHFVRPQFRVPLGQLLRGAGEALAASSDSAILARALDAWTILAAPTGEQLGALVARGAPDGTVWRVLPDGTIWVGRDTFPASALRSFRELDYNPREGRLDLGLDVAALLPGTTLGGYKIDHCEHVVDGAELRTRAWVVQ